MDTNKKSKNGFSIRDSFLNQDATICIPLAPPPIALDARADKNRRIYARVLR